LAAPTLNQDEQNVLAMLKKKTPEEYAAWKVSTIRPFSRRVNYPKVIAAYEAQAPA
jgi:hypothetical protein